MRITKPSSSPSARRTRIAALAGRREVWYESSSISLRPAPEALGSALLLPALGIREPLILDAPVSPVWFANVQRLLPIFGDWWHLPQLPPQAPLAEVRQEPPSSGSALCFSGGVDSFFSLLRGPRRPQYLVTLHGFDIPLRDFARMAAMESSLQQVAAGVGAVPVIIRTNLRALPVYHALSWEWSHGGFLASIGHLLSDHLGELQVSASRARDDTEHWGSHWKIDPLWSAERTRIVHVGEEVHRDLKLRKIAREPLVRQHLRVCWENRAPTGNCSRCYKCLGTRLLLADCGELENFKGLEGAATLVRDVDALPPMRRRLRVFRELAAEGQLQPDVKQSLRRFIARSETMKRQTWRQALPQIRRKYSWLIRYW